MSGPSKPQDGGRKPSGYLSPLYGPHPCELCGLVRRPWVGACPFWFCPHRQRPHWR
jgi:hypothetical protein